MLDSADAAHLRANVRGPTKVIVGRSVELPLFLARLPAGFPSPAEDHLEQALDISDYLIKRKKTTFFMAVVGDSMIGAGIHDGDLLVIDRAERAGDRAIVVARINDEFCVKRLRIIEGRPWLYSENDAYEPVAITEAMDFEIWGRVTHSITSHCPTASSVVAKIR